MDIIDGATPLDPDEIEGLIPTIINRAELNEFEQSNIYDALIWARNSRRLKRDLVNFEHLLLLHHKMFSRTWKWAGQIRRTAKNIGVEPYEIRDRLAQLIGDANYWVANKSFPDTEIAIRVHHKLVWIHPFANGNGRHARLVADLMLHYSKERKTLTWGGASLDVEGKTREQYLWALRQADRNNFEPLIQFATQTH